MFAKWTGSSSDNCQSIYTSAFQWGFFLFTAIPITTLGHTFHRSKYDVAEHPSRTDLLHNKFLNTVTHFKMVVPNQPAAGLNPNPYLQYIPRADQWLQDHASEQEVQRRRGYLATNYGSSLSAS